MKWAEIAAQPSLARFETLSEFLNQNGIANQFTPITATDDTFASVLERERGQFDFIRIGETFGQAMSSHQCSALIATLKCADCLVRHSGQYWPENLLYEGVQRLLALEHVSLDFSSKVLIAGTGAAVRSSIGALLRSGFTQVNITARSAEDSKPLFEDLRRTYFNTKFEFTEPSALTSLPGIHSLVINTTPDTDDNEILAQLHYFNFLRPGGVVLDFVVQQTPTTLLKGAIDVGGVAINGTRIASFVDQVWVEKYLKLKIDRDAYEQALIARLAQSSVG